jgi:isorenieratene synthase
LLQFFHFYFFGNPEGLAFHGTVDDMGTSLVMPMIRAIEARGGQVITEATVGQLQGQGEKITSLSYQQGDIATNVPFWVEPNELISSPPDNYYGAGDRVYLVPNDTSEALSLTCSHQGCTVAKQADGKFICPCHGAVYSPQGKVLQGPARRDLKRYRVQRQNSQGVELVAQNLAPASAPTVLEADYYVLAADVVGMKNLAHLLPEDLAPNLIAQLQNLAVADPFAVARFWFDQDFDWPHSNFASLSGYELTDSITLYHRIQTQFIDWAQQTGGSVVELHAYCYKEKDFPDQTSLLATFERELYEIVPALQGAQMLHRELVNQKNFSGFPPHSYGDRPSTETPISNLMVAGDWVKMPFPCGLMERAISSGLLAANSICQREGLQRRALLTVRPEGVFTL